MNTTLWFSSLFDQITDQQEQKIYENFYIKNLRENLWTQERVSNWRGGGCNNQNAQYVSQY